MDGRTGRVECADTITSVGNTKSWPVSLLWKESPGCDTNCYTWEGNTIRSPLCSFILALGQFYIYTVYIDIYIYRRLLSHAFSVISQVHTLAKYFEKTNKLWAPALSKPTETSCGGSVLTTHTNQTPWLELDTQYFPSSAFPVNMGTFKNISGHVTQP